MATGSRTVRQRPRPRWLLSSAVARDGGQRFTRRTSGGLEIVETLLELLVGAGGALLEIVSVFLRRLRLRLRHAFIDAAGKGGSEGQLPGALLGLGANRGCRLIDDLLSRRS